MTPVGASAPQLSIVLFYQMCHVSPLQKLSLSYSLSRALCIITLANWNPFQAQLSIPCPPIPVVGFIILGKHCMHRVYYFV